MYKINIEQQNAGLPYTTSRRISHTVLPLSLSKQNQHSSGLIFVESSPVNIHDVNKVKTKSGGESTNVCIRRCAQIGCSETTTLGGRAGVVQHGVIDIAIVA
jgi:hypothetical protein